MAAHTSGAGASISGKSYADPQGDAAKERWAFGILGALEQEENLLTRIPERTDRITINANLSTATASIDVVLNVVATKGANGSIIYTANHYLQGSTFTSGSGGDSTAPNLAQAVMEAIVEIKIIELDKTRNQSNTNAVTRCTHTINSSGGTNATFNALLEFPIEIISLPGGGNVLEGRVYLS
jgi:hypothetical protein